MCTFCDYPFSHLNLKETDKNMVKIYFRNSAKFIWPFKNLAVCKKL